MRLLMELPAWLASYQDVNVTHLQTCPAQTSKIGGPQNRGWKEVGLGGQPLSQSIKWTKI